MLRVPRKHAKSARPIALSGLIQPRQKLPDLPMPFDVGSRRARRPTVR